MATPTVTTIEQFQQLAQRTNTKINQVSVTIPTKVSQLSNDSKFQTEEQVNTAIANSTHLSRKKVTSIGDIDLSAVDADKYIYMVPKTAPGTDDIYDEYMVSDGKLEYVGNTKVDMSGYLTTDNIATDEQINTMLDNIFGAEN